MVIPIPIEIYESTLSFNTAIRPSTILILFRKGQFICGLRIEYKMFDSTVRSNERKRVCVSVGKCELNFVKQETHFPSTVSILVEITQCLMQTGYGGCHYIYESDGCERRLTIKLEVFDVSNIFDYIQNEMLNHKIITITYQFMSYTKVIAIVSDLNINMAALINYNSKKLHFFEILNIFQKLSWRRN